jgi:endonuclease/exonuclease/phosphatase (EEP) superfamily protein YafD
MGHYGGLKKVVGDMVRDNCQRHRSLIRAVSKFTLRSTEPTTVIFAGDFNDGGRFRLWQGFTPFAKVVSNVFGDSGQYDE